MITLDDWALIRRLAARFGEPINEGLAQARRGIRSMMLFLVQ